MASTRRLAAIIAADVGDADGQNAI